jgi:hypothetical protein
MTDGEFHEMSGRYCQNNCRAANHADGLLTHSLHVCDEIGHNMTYALLSATTVPVRSHCKIERAGRVNNCIRTGRVLTAMANGQAAVILAFDARQQLSKPAAIGLATRYFNSVTQGVVALRDGEQLRYREHAGFAFVPDDRGQQIGGRIG